MSITLEGLTRQQHQIADMLWRCDTEADVEELKSALPPEYQRDAELVHQLMIAAVMDQHMEITDYVQDLISRCRSR